MLNFCLCHRVKHILFFLMFSEYPTSTPRPPVLACCGLECPAALFALQLLTQKSPRSLTVQMYFREYDQKHAIRKLIQSIISIVVRIKNLERGKMDFKIIGL